jgi:hypothetical protein
VRVSPLVVISIALGCSSRYHVRPEHVATARQVHATGGGDVAIPALDSDREPTYLHVGSIRRTLDVDPYGLQEVAASDLRPMLRIVGWGVTGMGAVLGLTGLGTYSAGPELDEITTIVLIEAAAFAVIGLPVLFLGYAIDGPEAEGPSPGMPDRI